MAINAHGVVVGFSNVSAADGGAFRARAFVWTARSGMQDLGTLPGDAYSQALGVNARGQIVGTSCTAGFASCRAFLWQRGVMTDLDALVAPGYADHLFTANDIDDAGVITGQAVVHDTNAAVAFVARPTFMVAPPGAPVAHTLPEVARAALLARSWIEAADLAR